MSLQVTIEIMVYTLNRGIQTQLGTTSRSVVCFSFWGTFLAYSGCIRWFNELPRNLGLYIIYLFFPFILAEPSKTNIFRSGIRHMYPFIVDSPREMSVCQGKETHFPLELWPVAPIQFG